jgi:hypothetical protein
MTVSLNSQATEYYNKGAGFGYWYPGSWTSTENGRSAILSGSEFDQYKSEIFIGDNWDFSVTDIPSLKNLLIKKYGNNTLLKEAGFSTLKGFLIGNEIDGEYYLFRENNNYVYLSFSLKGSGFQLEQAQAILKSIYIRNDPYENK